MGQFTIRSKRDQDTEALEAQVTISDDDINRVTLAYGGIYFPNGVEVPETPATYDESGNVLTEAVPASVRAPTGQEIFNALSNGLLQGILNNTVSFEKEQAVRLAASNVAPIEVSTN